MPLPEPEKIASKIFPENHGRISFATPFHPRKSCRPFYEEMAANLEILGKDVFLPHYDLPSGMLAKGMEDNKTYQKVYTELKNSDLIILPIPPNPPTKNSMEMINIGISLKSNLLFIPVYQAQNEQNLPNIVHNLRSNGAIYEEIPHVTEDEAINSLEIAVNNFYSGI